MKNLKSKNIILGISGGIAAYKTPELARMLIKQGAEIKCVLTKNGAHFVTPLTLQTLSGNRVYTEMFDCDEFDVEHIALSNWAGLVVIAPATADALARFASGRAEDLLSSIVLSTKSPVLLCPSMNENMWNHPATRRNLELLRGYKYNFVMPEKGELACGVSGDGRLPGLETITSKIFELLENNPKRTGV